MMYIQAKVTKDSVQYCLYLEYRNSIMTLIFAPFEKKIVSASQKLKMQREAFSSMRN